MSPHALISRCLDLGLELETADGDLRVGGKRAAVVQVVHLLKASKPGVIVALQELAEDRLELIEERAAIMEFEAGLPRSEAERLAREEINRRMEP